MSANPGQGQRLEPTVRPELSLHLTPQMQLRLEILQANIVTLEEMLNMEIQQNPALELAEPEPEREPEDDQQEFSIEDFYPHGSTPGYQSGGEEHPETPSPCRERTSLEEQMMRGIASEFAGRERQYRIARYILEGLDEDGFLHEDSLNIAESLGVSPEEVEEVRAVIQGIHPVGIASRCVKEALLCQLEVMGFDEQSAEFRVVSEGFEEFLQKRITTLAHKLRLSTQRVSEAFEVISGLDPKPGRNFHEVQCRWVQPDIAITYRQGKLEVTVSEDPLPPLRLSRKFREILANPGQFSKQEVEFAKTKLENAQLFIKGILQRRQTLKRLTRRILLSNYDFFSARTHEITPLLMKDVADELELHASTISRAVRDKYIESPVGIFPLRSFFSKGEKNPMMTRIEEIINAENKENPLTDAQIEHRLEDMGVKVSRRTVAKYRLKLNIPDCFQRKALGE